jgi:hypothetical protein
MVRATFVACVFLLCACEHERPGAASGAPRSPIERPEPPRPQPITIPPAPLCEPVVSCGCYVGCGDFVPVEGDPTAFHPIGGTAVFRREPASSAARICDEYGRCMPPLVSRVDPCTGSCAPAPAPFRCQRVPSGACTRVDYGLTITDFSPPPSTRMDVVRRIVDAHRPELDRCFGGATVETNLGFEVGASGAPRRIEVVRGPAPLRACVRRAVGRWRFPAGEPIALSLRLRFEAPP